MLLSSASPLSSASSSRPSFLGRLRSSRIRSGRGAAASLPSRRRNSIARTPSAAQCSKESRISLLQQMLRHHQYKPDRLERKPGAGFRGCVRRARPQRPSDTPRGGCRRGGRAEPLPLHPAPGAAAQEEVPEGLHLEEGEDLPVSEVLQDAEEDERRQVLPAGVAAEGDLLQQNGGDRQEDPEEDGEDQEEKEEV